MGPFSPTSWEREVGKRCLFYSLPHSGREGAQATPLGVGWEVRAGAAPDHFGPTRSGAGKSFGTAPSIRAAHISAAM